MGRYALRGAGVGTQPQSDLRSTARVSRKGISPRRFSYAERMEVYRLWNGNTASAKEIAQRLGRDLGTVRLYIFTAIQAGFLNRRGQNYLRSPLRQHRLEETRSRLEPLWVQRFSCAEIARRLNRSPGWVNYTAIKLGLPPRSRYGRPRMDSTLILRGTAFETLRTQGFTFREIGRAFGVSRQRVEQMIRLKNLRQTAIPATALSLTPEPRVE